jgi:hypothetical protein
MAGFSLCGVFFALLDREQAFFRSLFSPGGTFSVYFARNRSFPQPV